MTDPLFLSLFTGGLALVLLESLSRLVLSSNPSFKTRAALNLAYQPSGFVCYCPTPNQVIYEREAGKVYYDKTRFRINKYGYRGEDFPLEKADQEIRFVFLGGSHVFDVYSFDYRNDVGFPHLIQQHFQEQGYGARVINAGLPGNDTRYFFTKVLLDLHRYRPDIIVISSIWNDLKWISRTDENTLFLTLSPKAIRKNPLTEKVNLLDTLLGFSCAYRHGRDAYWRKKLNLYQEKIIHEGFVEESNRESTDLARGLEQYKQNLIGVITLAKSIGATPVLAIEERFVSPATTDADKHKIPYHMVNVRTHAELVNLFDSCDAVIKEIAREYAAPIIDIQPLMEGKAEYFYDHIHTTPAGSQFIAKHYFSFLKRIIEARLPPGSRTTAPSTLASADAKTLPLSS